MLSAVFTAAVAAGISLAEKYDVGAVGHVVGQSKVSWFRAESRCRGVGMHLASLQVEGHLPALLEKARVPNGVYWLGARRSSRQSLSSLSSWKWADGTTFNSSASALSERLNTADELDAEGERNCLAAHIDGKNVVVHAASCSHEMSFICSESGDPDGAWRKAAHRLQEAAYPKAGKIERLTALITINGVLAIEDGVSKEVGLGRWVSPSRFMILSPGGQPCNWIADFRDAEKSKVWTGCEQEAGSTIGLKNATLERSEEVIKTAAPQTRPPFNTAGVPPTDTPTSPTRPLWTDPPPRTTAPPTPTSAVIRETKTKSDWSLPVYVWPIAFGVVAAVSAIAAVGVVRRRGKSPKSSDSSSVGPGRSGDEGDASPCTTCQRFDQQKAAERLLGVYAALQEEFLQPLRILCARCGHTKKDHVHIFTVANEFGTSSLGALSTVYSRTRPRLPRNTRIHIEQPNKEKKEKEKIEVVVTDGGKPTSSPEGDGERKPTGRDPEEPFADFYN